MDTELKTEVVEFLDTEFDLTVTDVEQNRKYMKFYLEELITDITVEELMDGIESVVGGITIYGFSVSNEQSEKEEEENTVISFKYR